MPLFPRKNWKLNTSLLIAGMILILIAGCTSQAGNPETNTATQSELDISGESDADELSPTVAPALETAAVHPTASPSPLPSPTPTENLELTSAMTTTTSLSETVNLITDTLASDETTSGTTAGSQAENPENGNTDPSLSSTITSTMMIEPPAVNGIPVESIIVFPDEVAENVRQIFDLGQEMGRDAHAFSKLGDSLIATPTFLTKFDVGPYNLGPYDYLQPTIDYYAGSYQRYGVALRPGLHAWGVFDPLWANKEWCQPNENLLACEFRLNNPSVVLILLGTNDVGNPPGFAKNMRQVVEFSIENGVIPVLVTKADRFEGPDNTNNNILRQIAADYSVPLWDFDLVAETLPGRGLSEDQVHLTVFVENDYTMPEAFQTGTGVHNLTGLMALDAVRRAIMEQ